MNQNPTQMDRSEMLLQMHFKFCVNTPSLLLVPISTDYACVIAALTTCVDGRRGGEISIGRLTRHFLDLSSLCTADVSLLTEGATPSRLQPPSRIPALRACKTADAGTA